MNIKKIETNYNKKYFLKDFNNIKYKKYSKSLENEIVNIYPEITYQDILGFGGAFSEATGVSLSKLQSNKKDEALNEYFSKSGLNYNFCRLPIASTDFSLKSYSYCTKNDLSDFSIEKDRQYIINIVKQALKINPNIKFISSPWSPPKFMKNNKMLILGGKLLDKYKNLYADYLVKYIKAYEKENINIDYITVQNEPNAIQLWESCLYSPEEECDMVLNYIYPKFKENNINTKILIWDHNKEKLYTRILQELNFTEKAKDIISGAAFHFYSGSHFENIALLRQNNDFKDKLLIHTEGCTGYSNFNEKDFIHNAEIYAHDILGDLLSGANGYIDWNLVLDNNGGPNHKKNYCDSPIMLNKDNTDYIKNLSFYYIAHFSKYIKRNAKVLAISRYTTDIETLAIKNPDDSIAIIMLNKFGFDKKFNICINGFTFSDKIEAHSIITYVISEN